MEPSDAAELTELSLRTLDSDGFDYMAFFQDNDVDYLANDGSSSSSSTLKETLTAPGVPSSTTAVARISSSHKARLVRRGHTKSRRGCYNCKRRRIKCQESQPSCGHCLKAGLKCEYPAVPLVTHQPQHQIPLFSIQDMRFFQHFLLSCFPHYPLKNESIWTHEVPCLSQNHEYLMHAILGLAASDLMAQDPSLVMFAMMHRLKAIKAIKKTLNDVSKMNTFEEGNALVATCFALTFQSVCLDDGMGEFMTFCRGIVIVMTQMFIKGVKFVFSNLVGDNQQELLRPFLEAMPLIRRDWTDMAVAGIRALEPLCKRQVEIEYYQLLSEMVEALYTSSFIAYQLLSKHYGWWMQISHEDFQYIIDPRNQTCMLLASHWIALKRLMITITRMENRAGGQEPKEKDGDIDPGTIRWLKYLNRQVDIEHQRYNQWPVWVEAQLDKDIRYFENAY
ncbi:C6 zinc finger protein [Xylariaceae sp. FL0662B]|nr:C6 zinc finger protein [Xylariaceae sp. FL0662B]